MAIVTTNLHEFGPQNAACSSGITAQDDTNLLDEDGNALCMEEGGFEFKMSITGSSFKLELPAQTGYPDYTTLTYSFTVDWGDGNTDIITAYDQTEVTHSYSVSGTYIVSIEGVCESLDYGGSTHRSKINSITQWGDVGFTYMYQAFDSCYNMGITATDTPKFSGMTDVRYMFQNTEVTTGAENWDFTGITDISGMFYQCTNFQSDCSGWTGMGGITNMYRTFSYCERFNSSIANWDTSAVTIWQETFFFCDDFNHSSIQDLDVSAGVNFVRMLSFAQSLTQPLPWTFQNVLPIDMTAMFRSCDDFNGDISGWDVSAVTTMNSMFEDCFSFNQDLLLWDTGNVVDFGYWMDSSFGTFYGVFAGDVSNFDTSSCTSMSNMFRNQDVFNSDLSGWDVSNVTDMSDMFYKCYIFDSDLTLWNVEKVTDMSGMFFWNFAFNGNVVAWNPIACTDMTSMFALCDLFNQDISGWNVSSVTNMTSMFQGALDFDQDISSWDVDGTTVTNMLSGANLFSTANYDLLLNGWAAHTVATSQTFTVTPAYTIVTSQTARDTLTNAPNNWTITDGGGI